MSSDELIALTWDTLDKQDINAAIELLRSHPPVLAAQAYAKVQSGLYWNRKQVRTLMAWSRAGIEHGLKAADDTADAAEANTLRSIAKGMAYDLASFTWPGWDEAGIELSVSDIAAGLDAAKLNLRLAEELNKPLKARANAHWVLGAQQLAIKNYSSAMQQFDLAAALAIEIGDAAFRLMFEGYSALARTLAASECQPDFDRALAALNENGSNDAKQYTEQLVTAFRVFQKAQGTAEE